MSSLEAQQPTEWAVIALVGVAVLLALAGCLYTVPWRRGCAKATQSFSVLWRGRAALCLLSLAWAAAQLLRVELLWGPNSVLFGSGVTSWTGAGWMCRIYLTVALGVMQPLCAFAALLMLAAALSRRHRPEAAAHPTARLLGLALLCALPVAAAQAAVAWLGLAVQHQGQPAEASPRSVVGIFFATYWQGSPQACGGGSQSCTACAFPAAAVIVHGLFLATFLAALCITSNRLASAVLNTRLKRRVRLFQLAYSLLALAGLAALAVSVVQGPFSWLSAGCWLAYVASVAASVVLVVWEVAVWPVKELRAVDKRLALWADASTAALAAAGGDPPSQGGLQPSSLIKAHNRSSEAEAFVLAAAAARARSAAQLDGRRLVPAGPAAAPSKPPSPCRASPRRPVPQRPLSPQRQLSLTWQQRQQYKLALGSPQRGAAPPQPQPPPGGITLADSPPQRLPPPDPLFPEGLATPRQARLSQQLLYP